MKLVTFRHHGVQQTGVLNTDATTVAAVPGGQDLLSLIDNWAGAAAQLAASTGEAIPVAEVELLAPIPLPRRNIFCVGRNYASMPRNSPAAASTPGQRCRASRVPIVFTKAPSTVTAPAANLTRNRRHRRVDYEAELGVIIGPGGRGISKADAWTTSGATRSSTTSPPATCRKPQAVAPGQEPRHLRPMGPWAVTPTNRRRRPGSALRTSTAKPGRRRPPPT